MSGAPVTGEAVVCVDFGSTFTKALLVDLDSGAVAASAAHATTIGTDVLDGFEACLAVLTAQDARAADAEVLACSSAGGGLRIAVVGNEELVTAEAGRRVALSSGGRVVAVLSGGLGEASYDQLRAAGPDVLLLVGGTDGGNAEVLLHDAAFLAHAGWSLPVVVAGNVEAQAEVARGFEESGTPYVLADNVVPRIGVLAPDSARAAIREMFLRHVIGGKGLSASPAFAEMVVGATPDVVLTGVELLARGLGPDAPGVGDVVVVDVGGATTDVHSFVETDPEDAGLAREVVATTALTRTVEGDLGMRWSAPSTAEAAGREDLREAAERRQADPGFLPGSAEETLIDTALAAAAVEVALKRHAGRSKVVLGPDGRVVERTGKDLREVDLLVGSGGVLRARGTGASRAEVLGPATGEHPGGWQLPRAPRIVVDDQYVLAAAGLLAVRHPLAAHRLVRTLAVGGRD
ncbi:MAG: glutamate mutase L [Nocardioides sp.]|uniref:glutamate mutase L n=1 Tax=Nocardioides sp. TaxID=35761 RepID=UPI003EFCDA61